MVVYKINVFVKSNEAGVWRLWYTASLPDKFSEDQMKVYEDSLRNSTNYDIMAIQVACKRTERLKG